MLISSQNHGFAVDEATLPENLRATHRSLFDGSLQGVARTDRPAFSFQGHPEASPGPHDLRLLFEHFMYLMVKRMQANFRGRGTGQAEVGRRVSAAVPKRTDLESILIIGAGPDHHRPGLRVRLFWSSSV